MNKRCCAMSQYGHDFVREIAVAIIFVGSGTRREVRKYTLCGRGTQSGVPCQLSAIRHRDRREYPIFVTIRVLTDDTTSAADCMHHPLGPSCVRHKRIFITASACLAPADYHLFSFSTGTAAISHTSVVLHKSPFMLTLTCEPQILGDAIVSVAH
jgi:hypothetical protein